MMNIESSIPVIPNADCKWAAVVFAICASFLVWTALPGPHWHDTSEFGAVGWWLSISHPPGHPVHAILTHGMERVGLGDIAFRANLLSAVLLSLALVGFFLLLRRMTPGIGRIGAACASLAPVLMPAVWLQGVRAEVYALQLLLSVAIAACCLSVARGRDHRSLIVAALLFGLAGANHSLLGLMLVPFALLAMVVGRSSLRSIGWSCGAGVLGLSAYWYLPLRSSAGREVGWGTPDTVARIWEIISAREWSRSVSIEGGGQPWDEILSVLTGYVFEQMGPITMGILFCVAAVAAPAFVRRRRWLALTCAGLVATPFLFRLVYPPDLLNPDLGGYLALGMVALIALLGMAVEEIPGPSWVRGGLLSLVLLIIGTGFTAGGRSEARSAERFARQLFDETPPGGVLVYSDYASFFQGWYLRAAEGVRPDVKLVFRGQVHRPWFKERLGRHNADFASTVSDFPKGFAGPEVRFEPGVRLEQLGEIRQALKTAGLTLSIRPQWGDAKSVEQAFTVFLGDDRDSVRNQAYFHAQHLEHLLHARGPAGLLRWHLSHLEELAPNDPWVEALRDRVKDEH